MWRFLSYVFFLCGVLVVGNKVLPMRKYTLWHRLHLALSHCNLIFFATWSPGVSKACRNPVDR